jgi:hypothetical protein
MITLLAASAVQCMAALQQRQNDQMKCLGLDNVGAPSLAIELVSQICTVP